MRGVITLVWIVVALAGGALPGAAESLETRRQRVFEGRYRELEQILSDPRSTRRLEAVLLLEALLASPMERPAEARALVAWLERDPDPQLARPAAALGRRLDGELGQPPPPPRAPAGLFGLLPDDSPNLRLTALRRLMIYARRQRPEIDPRIQSALEGALEDPDPRVHHYARFMLDGLAGNDDALRLVRNGREQETR